MIFLICLDTGDAAGLFHLFVPAPILKGSPLQEEVNLALELIQKELKLISSDQPTVGQGPEPGGWRGLQLVTEVANLTEEAFGWDSIEAAIAYKQVQLVVFAINKTYIPNGKQVIDININDTAINQFIV